MRVMQVIAGGAKGGAETFFVNLTLALHRAGLDQRVIIRTNPERAGLLRAGGIEPLELRFGRLTDFATVPALKREVARYRPVCVTKLYPDRQEGEPGRSGCFLFW